MKKYELTKKEIENLREAIYDTGYSIAKRVETITSANSNYGTVNFECLEKEDLEKIRKTIMKVMEKRFKKQVNLMKEYEPNFIY